MTSVSVEDAVSYMLSELSGNNPVIPTMRHNFGYDVAPLMTAIRWAYGVDNQNYERLGNSVSPTFLEAGWILCRRGILRPGVAKHDGQTIASGGYSLTSYGREWLDAADPSQFVIMEAGSLARVLAEFNDTFGEGFAQRSQEAVRCRNAEAWLACCAMVGAASESILLAIAISKSGDEARIITQYSGKSGRSAIIKFLAGSLQRHAATTLQNFMGLLSYWRDEAAHGQSTELSLANADEALRQLLHLCQWADKNWKALTE
jgi:hypothetical protein